MISERINKEKDIIYKLITDNESFNKIFSNLGIYIPKFMYEIWKSPKSISTILLNADRSDVKNNLAHFIVHNLYDNISSLNHKDEQLIYIITLLLKNEINSLKNINSVFLGDSCCGIIVKELNKKKEVQFFFKNIILEIIKEIETTYHSDKIILDPNEIIEFIEISSFKEDNMDNNISIKKDKKYENNEKMKLIDEKYLMVPVNKEELNKALMDYKDKDMKDFLEKKIKKIESSESQDIYLNQTFLENVYFHEKSNEIMEYYKKSFIQVIDIIDKIFDSLLNKIDLLPYSIKCICKIISILVENKFPEAIKVEKNKFLFNFFFYNLFFPILINPSLNTFLNECMISDSIMEKLKLLTKILNGILLGKLYEKNHLTPFNWYIIEKMPKVIEFLNNICQVTLPPFIDKIIKNNFQEDYEYNYFKENPEENILYRNICFSINELCSLISNCEKSKNDISIDKIFFEKFQLNNKLLEKLKNNEEYEEISNNNLKNKKRIKKYFLLQDSIYNEKFDNIIRMKKYKNNHFTLKELKKIDNNEEKRQNRIIKIKNLFFSFLYNYQSLSKYNFNFDKLSDMIKILKEFKNQNDNSSIYTNDIQASLNWYINSLLQYLPRLPEKLKTNDYEELLNELEYEINNSIKELDFGRISDFIEYFKEIEKEKLYFKKLKNIIIDIDLNEKAQQIIENEQFVLDINLKDNKTSQYFKSLLKNEKNFSSLFNKTEKNKIYSNIKTFIDKFPNSSNYQFFSEEDVFDILEKNNTTELVKKYIDIIKDCLIKNNIFNKDEYTSIINKIYDYITEHLYDKIFPKETLPIDLEIFKNCYKHAWVELSNLTDGNTNFNYENFLPDLINYFHQFEKEKSPRKKVNCIKEIYNCVYNVCKFNGDELVGADDEFPLLNYYLIKSKPERIYSNCRYTEIFLRERAGKTGSQITKLLGICERMKKLDYKDLFNIPSTSDYDFNCEYASKGILY